MKSDRNVHQPYDNRITAAQKARQEYRPRTLGRLRQSASNAAWSASQAIHQFFAWFVAVAFIVMVAAGIGVGAWVVFNLFR